MLSKPAWAASSAGRPAARRPASHVKKADPHHTRPASHRPTLRPPARRRGTAVRSAWIHPGRGLVPFGRRAPGPAADRSARFRAGVELVQLDVAVLDDKRQPVRGLTAADFTVLDNGVAAPIRAFTPVELAPRTRSTEAVWANEAPPDVVTNQVGQQDRRLVIILMDRSNPLPGARRVSGAENHRRRRRGARAPRPRCASSRRGWRLHAGAELHRRPRGPSRQSNHAARLEHRNRPGVPVGVWTEGRGAREMAVVCAGCASSRPSPVFPMPCADAPRRRKLLLFIGRGLVGRLATPGGVWPIRAVNIR